MSTMTTTTANGHRPRAKANRLATTLAASELFCDLDPIALARLAEHAEMLSVPGGQLLIRQGETGDDLFVIVSGRVRASTDQDGEVLPLEELGPGQVVGELSMLSRQPRAATVRAIRDSTLVRLSGLGFERAVRSHPEIALALAPVLVRRLGEQRAHGHSPPRTIAVLAAGSPSPRLGRFAQDLTRQLALLGRATRVSSRTIERRFGPRSRRLAEISAWLHSLEDRDGFVVYQADAGVTEWTRRCLRQADRILLVGDITAAPTPGPIEGLLDRAGAATELVLVRPYGTKPTGTAGWLSQRNVVGHHHVELGNAGDASRVSRLLAGRAVSLVLGGGGARGFAHLGVVRAFEEAGVPIDAVGGTSIGSIMAAGLAMGWNASSLVDTCMAGFVRTRFLVGVTPPALALSSARKITAGLQRQFGDTQIEDLPIRYFCMSTSLTTGRSVVHEQGPLWEAVRASISLPGILPPVCRDGELLVDGSVLDDVPVGAMRARANGTVVSVELSNASGLRADEQFPPVISGWRVLGRRLRRRGTRLPSALDILQSSKEVAMRAAQPTAQADVVLRPPVDGCRSLDFRHADVLIDPAYRYAVDALSRRWPRAEPARLRA